MPLHRDAVALIRSNLEMLAAGGRVRPVVIGDLTAPQLAAINAMRVRNSLPPIIAEILFFGHHIHTSRIVRDGYTIEDVIDQIISALDAAATFIPNPGKTALQNNTGRADRYGNRVRDLAVLECTRKHPRPELFSVMPKGDTIKPKQ